MPLEEQHPINQSSLAEFLLMEFSHVRELQILHFIMFLLLYLAAVTANLLIISVVAFDHHLHTPMYFFLMNLAIQDVGQLSVTVPKSMTNSLLNIRHISYWGCVAQVFLFPFFLASDFSLLTAMAYDRYVAICNPLQYGLLMNKKACIQMVSAVWVVGFFYGVLHAGGTFAPPFCSNVVNQFFCEIPQLMKLTCSNSYQFEICIVFISAIVGLGCFIFIVVSYVHIFTAVLKVPSVQGRQKAFATCLPHLFVFAILVFTGCFAYLVPTSNSPAPMDLGLTMGYTIVPPLMNPVIYSMRNKDIQHAVSKLFGLKYLSSVSLPILQR